MIKQTMIGILGGALLFSASAFAQDPNAPVTPPAMTPAMTPATTPATPPSAAPEVMGGGGPPPITGVRAGGLAVWGSLDINASKGAFAKPFGIAPDIFYGVSDVLSVGLAHSNWATNGFAGGGGGGLCLAGTSNGCAKAYNNVGILGKYALSDSLAAEGGLVLASLDPMFAGIKAGVTGRLMAGPLMVMYSPNLYIGATKRDLGNKERLNVPVAAMMPAGPVMAGIQTGLYSPLSKFGDSFGIPLSLMGMMHVNPNLMAGAAFTFNRIAGKASSADSRTLNLFVGWMN